MVGGLSVLSCYLPAARPPLSVKWLVDLYRRAYLDAAMGFMGPLGCLSYSVFWLMGIWGAPLGRMFLSMSPHIGCGGLVDKSAVPSAVVSE